MIINLVYTAVRDRLLDPAWSTPVRQVDWFNHQPEKLERQLVTIDDFLLPAALVRLDPIRWHALGNYGYQADAVIYIDILQDAVDGLASAGTPTEVERARAAQDNVNAVARALNALSAPNIGTFTMMGMEMDHAYTKVRVDTIAFRSRLFTSNDLRNPVSATPALADSYTI